MSPSDLPTPLLKAPKSSYSLGFYTFVGVDPGILHLWYKECTSTYATFGFRKTRRLLGGLEGNDTVKK